MSQPTLLLIDSDTLIDLINFARSGPEIKVQIESNSESRTVHTEDIEPFRMVDAYAQIKDIAGRNPENRFIKEFREVDALDAILPNDFGNISTPSDDTKIDLTIKALNQMIVEVAKNAPDGVTFHPECISAITYVINRNLGDVQAFDSNAEYMSSTANLLSEDAEDQVDFIVSPLVDRFSEINELLGFSDAFEEDFEVDDEDVEICEQCTCGRESQDGYQSDISIGNPNDMGKNLPKDFQEEIDTLIKDGQKDGKSAVEILENIISHATDSGYAIRAGAISRVGGPIYGVKL